MLYSRKNIRGRYKSMKRRPPLNLPMDIREKLTQISRSRTEPAGKVKRASVLLMYDSGKKITEITRELAAALRGKFSWKLAISGQLFFLVLFSYSFFLKGITGLTIAIGSVVTLAILMKATVNVDWNRVFAKAERPGSQAPPPLVPPIPNGGH